ncbi:MAG: mannonate dehydratase [Chloroflexota bacterium]|nr:mannonate dehydratase [Chloroflexota bacterium]
MRIKVAEVLNPLNESTMRLAKQIGITHIVGGLPPEDRGPVWDALPLARLKSKVEDAGLKLEVLEGPPPMDKITLGLPGRDEQIQEFCQSVRNVGAVGIPIICYNFMAGFNWLRTSTTTRTRGDAKVTSFDYDLVKNAQPTKAGVVPEEKIWENYEHFIRRVLPVCEEAKVKLALHPDDPPVSPLLGIGRVFRNVEAFDRAMQLGPSDYHGITFCQGCFSEMSVDVPKTIHHFGKKLFFAHFRDVRGAATKFTETFHDDGKTDMFAAMKAYDDAGFDGPMRPDHVPEMEGDPTDRPGYTVTGRIFAIGYMKGIMDAVDSVKGRAKQAR